MSTTLLSDWLIQTAIWAQTFLLTLVLGLNYYKLKRQMFLNWLL